MIDSVVQNKRGILHECEKKSITVNPCRSTTMCISTCRAIRSVLCVCRMVITVGISCRSTSLRLSTKIKPYAEHITLIGGEPLCTRG